MKKFHLHRLFYSLDFVNHDFCKYQFSQTPDKCLTCVLGTVLENQTLFLATRINKLLQAFDDVHSYDYAPNDLDTTKHVVESFLVKGISSKEDDDDDDENEIFSWPRGRGTVGECPEA